MSMTLAAEKFIYRQNKLVQLFDAFVRRMHSFLAARNWKIRVAVFCTLYCIVTSLPNYLNFSARALEKSEYRDMLKEQYGMLNQQIDHPFTQVKGNSNTHAGRLAFRFVPAVIAKIIPSDNLQVRMAGVYLFNNIAGFLLFFAVASLVYGFAQDKLIAALAAFNMSVLYIGKSFFFDTFLWNDGIAYCFLILALLRVHPLLKILFLLLAYFTDERALFGGGLVYAYFMLVAYYSDNKYVQIKYHLPYLASYLLYVIIRLLLQHSFGLQTSVSKENSVALFLYLEEIKSPLLAFTGLFFPFKLWWIVLLMAAWWMRKRWWTLLVYLGALAALLVISLSLYDVSRSITYAYIAILIAMFFLYRRTLQFGVQKQAYVFFLLLLCNFIIPTIYIINAYFHMIPPLEKIVHRLSM